MASRQMIQQQTRGEEEGVPGASKNMTAERKNRRALGDIGNMVTIRDVNGKPLPQVSRPVTRSFCAQLLANAQAAAAAENNKCLAVNPNVVVDGAQAQPAKTLQKRAVAKPKPQEIIVISLDSKEDKPKAKAGEMSLKKRLAACGPKVDIDAADANNHLAVVEYIDEIYQFYKLLRYPEGMAGDYMDSQPEINAKMRAIMVDWLVQVHNKFDLSPETLYLTINLVDRYLASKKTQLVGLGAMLIASKYEEIWAPEVNELVFISDRTYSCADILAMEKKILGQLEWSLTVPTPYVFLARFIKASMTDAKVENMVYLLGELAMMNYSRAIRYSPSLIAASAVYAVRCTLSIAPAWNETGLLEEQLMECAKMLATFHSMLLDGNMRGIYRKYQGSDREAVALLPPPNSLLLP
ncbi:G2/mitotic-specific cyclin-1-like [Salvia splendens]|uniref:G2/mitotic-specific cyclin-1-like n=1 Tax=Salvia splendens TaxID=180675 RepID=UPI001C25DDAE|nr:G2/mitotic-specific cyclin-1-like [Salvia splendens]